MTGQTGTNQRPRVLLIEDDPLTRCLASALLAISGHHVRAEPDARALDAVMEEFAPDLVIVNVRHSVGPDGFAVARLLKRDAPDLALLFLTASENQEDRLAAFAAGADDYLTKGAMLVPRVRALLERTGVLPQSRLARCVSSDRTFARQTEPPCR